MKGDPNPNPLSVLLTEISPDSLIDSIDAMLIDYALFCVDNEQSAPAEEAKSNIRNVKALRDALKQSSNC
jgi:hypothetical protein